MTDPLPELPRVRAPEFPDALDWIHTGGHTPRLAELRGRVVMLDFWTYGCINCLNHLLSVQQWHERYKDQGLVVVGVHTPEFAYERSTKNVQDAVARLKVRHPVVQDNRFAIWKAFDNRYWPALYLIDAQGLIVYEHVGEGAYAQTEAKIRELLGQRTRSRE
jgi:thiol-disulfide isomerase/thioredoxin